MRRAQPDLEFDEIDRAFERLESGTPAPDGADSALSDLLAQNEQAELLRQIAVDQARCLRERMREVASSRTTRRLVATIRPLLESLRKAVDALDSPTLVPHLVTLDALVEHASRARSPILDEGTREALLAAHARVDAEIARVFDVAFEPVRKARH